MSQFAVECPKCGCINEKKWYNGSILKCTNCGEELNFKKLRMVARVCSYCGNTFVHDQKKETDKCPICGTEMNKVEAFSIGSMTEQQWDAKNKVRVSCPQCACAVDVNKNTPSGKDKCPVCDFEIDVKLALAKADLVSDTGVSVIQYEGDNSTFVWKHPIEDFNLGSQLIVHESQEAIFFLNGEALDTFGPGRHTLETENLPVLQKVYSLPTEGRNPFHAEVYFINKTVQMGMKWGTDSRVRFIDPITGIPLDIGASGELNLQVSDSRKLLIKLVGTTNGLTNRQVLSSTGGADSKEVHKTLQAYFRAPLMTEIKSYLASVIKEKHINIFEIDSHLSELSEALCKIVSPKFEEYGLTIPQFYVTAVSLPEDDKNFNEIKELISSAYIGVKREEIARSVAEAAQQRQIVEEQTKAQLNIIKAQGEAEAEKMTGLAEAAVMRAKGYTQKDVFEADYKKTFAESIGNIGGSYSGGSSGSGKASGGSSGGSLVADVVGLMAGLKVAETVWTCLNCGETGNKNRFCMSCGKERQDVDAHSAHTWICSKCGESKNTGNFCMNCGEKRSDGKTSWTCPQCGQSDNTMNFCMNCGAKKPE